MRREPLILWNSRFSSKAPRTGSASRRETTTLRSRGATPRKPPTDDTSMAMVFVESVCSEADHAEAHDGANSDSVWGIKGIMAKDILPDRPADRRRRSRLCALRAMDRLGLLGEGDPIPTLVRRPDLRWLTDEEGARWAVFGEPGRIAEPDTFEEVVEWMLENHPSPKEAKTYIRRRRACARRPYSASRMGRRLVKARTGALCEAGGRSGRRRRMGNRRRGEGGGSSPRTSGPN